jgi:hypothetical protein
MGPITGGGRLVLDPAPVLLKFFGEVFHPEGMASEERVPDALAGITSARCKDVQRCDELFEHISTNELRIILDNGLRHGRMLSCNTLLRRLTKRDVPPQYWTN